MPDRRERITADLEHNRRRREEAYGELEGLRQELQRLLVRGQAAGLTVLAMARLAGISRESAHKFLRRGRSDG